MPSRRIQNVSMLILVFLVCSISGSVRAQDHLDRLGRDRVRAMLHDGYKLVSKYYYDPAYHNIDWQARYKEYEQKIKSAKSYDQAFNLIAGFLNGLNDSHTYFLPPERPFHVDYGYRLQIIGNHAFIVRVRPGTDAGEKVHAGEEVMSLDNIVVNRDDMWKLNYYFNALAPQAVSHLTLRDLDGKEAQVNIKTKVRQGTKDADITSLFLEAGIQEGKALFHPEGQHLAVVGDVMLWKMQDFEVPESFIDHTFKLARKHKALVLDLRGDPGGAVEALKRMIGSVMDHDVKICDRVGRTKMRPQIAKSRKRDVFSGKLIVLVDSDSASAAEIFARVIQLEHRGIVLGDRTSGRVMEAQLHPSSYGGQTRIVFYGFSVTDADLIMSDGKSLEHHGVVPDEVILPTPEDLASGRDPVLSHALRLVGVNSDPTAAGKLLPYKRPPL